MKLGRRAGTTLMALVLAFTSAFPSPFRAGLPEPGQKKRKALSDEKNPQYQFEKGMIALRYGLTDEAVRYGTLGVELDPGHFNCWTLLGSAYYTKGEYARSVEAYERALGLKPDAAEIHRNLGLAYFEVRETAKAETAFLKAWEMKGDAEAALYLARLYYNEKKLEAALDFAQKSLQKDARNAGAYNLKGVILNQMGRTLEAVGSFQAGLVLVPGDVGIQVNLGIAYVNGNEPQKARAVFERVLPGIQDPVLKAKVEGYLKSLEKR